MTDTIPDVPDLPYLMVTPFFPPNNYVGAKRALHFAVHLQRYHYRPVVITLGAEYEADPALEPLVPDVDLCRWIRPPQKSAQPVTAKSVPRSKTPHLPWWAGSLAPLKLQYEGLKTLLDRFSPGAVRAFPRVVHKTWTSKCQLVYATFGPLSGVLMGAAVARTLQLPLVLDFRDPYTLEPNLRANWSPEAVVQAEHLERWLFRSAHTVVLNTEAALDAYRNHYAGEFPETLFTCIRNHFDPALYAPVPAPPPSDSPFRIMYYGHLRPSKNALLFAKAYQTFIKQTNLTPDETKLTMLGDITPEDQAEFAKLGLQSYVESHPWVPFTESTRLLGKAALLLDLMGPGHALQISGKLYDYFAARRPILAISPNQELDRIFQETGMGVRAELNEPAIVAALVSALKNHRSDKPFTPNEAALKTFSAEMAAQKMAEIFERARQVAGVF